MFGRVVRWFRHVEKDAASREPSLCSGAYELGATLGPRLRNVFGKALEFSRSYRVPSLEDYRRTVPDARS